MGSHGLTPKINARKISECALRMYFLDKEKLLRKYLFNVQYVLVSHGLTCIISFISLSLLDSFHFTSKRCRERKDFAFWKGQGDPRVDSNRQPRAPRSRWPSAPSQSRHRAGAGPLQPEQSKRSARAGLAAGRSHPPAAARPAGSDLGTRSGGCAPRAGCGETPAPGDSENSGAAEGPPGLAPRPPQMPAPRRPPGGVRGELNARGLPRLLFPFAPAAPDLLRRPRAPRSTPQDGAGPERLDGAGGGVQRGGGGTDGRPFQGRGGGSAVSGEMRTARGRFVLSSGLRGRERKTAAGEKSTCGCLGNEARGAQG